MSTSVFCPFFLNFTLFFAYLFIRSNRTPSTHYASRITSSWTSFCMRFTNWIAVSWRWRCVKLRLSLSTFKSRLKAHLFSTASANYSTYLFRQRLCSRLTALWRFTNSVLLFVVSLFSSFHVYTKWRSIWRNVKWSKVSLKFKCHLCPQSVTHCQYDARPTVTYPAVKSQCRLMVTK